MKKRELVDYLGYFLNGTTITEEEPILSLLNRIDFDLGSVTVEVLKEAFASSIKPCVKKTLLKKWRKKYKRQV